MRLGSNAICGSEFGKCKAIRSKFSGTRGEGMSFHRVVKRVALLERNNESDGQKGGFGAL